MKHIGLRKARHRAGLTQKQLEDLSGVDRSRISYLETTADNPTLDTARKLEGALREKNGLRRNEQLVFGPKGLEEQAAAS